MRSWIYIMVIGLTMSACTNLEESGTIVSVLEDTTESDFVAKPNATRLKKLFNLDTDSWQSAIFRYGSISSLVHNVRDEEKLLGGTALLGNQLERDVQVKNFYSRIDSILCKREDKSIHQYSSIWEPIVEELRYLQQDTLSSKTLYIYSDLQENNSDWFSVHSYNDLLRLNKKPQEVKTLFLKHASGLNKGNSRIKVIVVYQPRTIEEDKAFTIMKNLYTQIFAELQIRIDFVSNLN